MSALDGLRPENVFHYFELLSSVPHGSGNTKQISDLCVDFAVSHGLEHYQDSANNIIIIKEATEGYECSEPVILQGHLDMVCVKDEDIDIDMKTEPIRLMHDDEWVFADRTSLGGDNAIGVAMIMAILDDDSLSHPRIEAVFTTDEETGMDGAVALDVSHLKAKMMINLDSEHEGVITAGCAGGARVDCTFPLSASNIPHNYICLRSEISGLLGGHSGIEINKGHGNAIVLMGRYIQRIRTRVTEKLILVSLSGGKFDNVIPKASESVFAIPESEFHSFKAETEAFINDISKELSSTDPGFSMKTDRCECGYMAISEELSEKIVNSLIIMPFGVQSMSADISGLVQSSLNMGVAKIGLQSVCFSFSVRSSIKSEKEYIIDRIAAIMKSLGGNATVRNAYPGWEFQKHSPLREIVAESCKKILKKPVKITATHGGLECGMFMEKIPGLDCVSIGPDLFEVHSTSEKLSIDSTKHIYDIICDTLKNL